MEIRRGNTNDIDGLLAIRMEFLSVVRHNEVTLSEELPAANYEYIKKHIEEESLVVWLAEENEKIVSVAMICYYQLIPSIGNPNGKTGYIQNVYTLSDYRGRGFATELVKKILLDARERKISRLLLHASDMGKPVYEKIGFQLIANEMEYRF